MLTRNHLIYLKKESTFNSSYSHWIKPYIISLFGQMSDFINRSYFFCDIYPSFKLMIAFYKYLFHFSNPSPIDYAFLIENKGRKSGIFFQDKCSKQYICCIEEKSSSPAQNAKFSTMHNFWYSLMLNPSIHLLATPDSDPDWK